MILADAWEHSYDVAEIAVAVVVIIGAVGGLIRWLIRHEMRDMRDETKELRPNGGSHLADKIARTEDKVDSVAEIVAANTRSLSELIGAFKQYARDHDPRG